ncbi:hypothetical protein HGRIS_014172 [Hohenbuehelia grisea]|uniref:HTH Mu-type domain-containing protein n=1 Tax=Hohenbuehelia grisea TaxID=104357 RepID=A0ABR3JUA7_9AGAR
MEYHANIAADLAVLPVSQLESLRFKANQIVESILSLQATLLGGPPNAMPTWPDILSKYNIILSQTHSLSTSLLHPIQSSQQQNQQQRPTNPFAAIALHPPEYLPDAELKSLIFPLIATVQSESVRKRESSTIWRLSKHLSTRGTPCVLGRVPPAPLPFGGEPTKPEYEDVLAECTTIREEHDRRVDRAVRAVNMLREQFDWKQRVQVEVEEPDELDWDPRMGMPEQTEETQQDGMDSDGDGGSSDEDEVEGALVTDGGHTPASSQTLGSYPVDGTTTMDIS